MKSYHDFVIKNGEFLGDFEKMYQIHEDPWGQSSLDYYSSISRRAVCYFIQHYQLRSIVEFGCGLGQTSNFIQKNTGVDILGVDISSTSIAKAKMTFPDLEFEIDNISNIVKYINYDCIFMSEITWYLLENHSIDNLFDAMKKHMHGKYFIHNLVFYKGENQKYGKDYFTNLDEFIQFCPFDLLAKTEIDIQSSSTIETSAIFKI